MAVIWTEIGVRDAITSEKTNGTSSVGIGIVGRGREGEGRLRVDGDQFYLARWPLSTHLDPPWSTLFLLFVLIFCVKIIL